MNRSGLALLRCTRKLQVATTQASKKKERKGKEREEGGEGEDGEEK